MPDLIMRLFFAKHVKAPFLSLCVLTSLAVLSGCGSSDSGGGVTSSTDNLNSDNDVITDPPVETPPSNPISSGSVEVCGQVAYERVPHTASGALNFNASFNSPARLVRVEALDTAGNTTASVLTNSQGNYCLTLPNNSQFSLRVLAQLEVGNATIPVLDNTDNEALYALVGEQFNSGESNTTRNLTAESGWSGASYTESRSAAPFAILDDILNAIEFIQEGNSGFSVSNFNVFWSPNNRPIAGEVTLGEITSSSYQNSAIYILGDASSDTDEFDTSVIQHEFFHYLEDTQSRTDNLGGAHGSNDKLDPRIAYSEGLANAFAGIVSGDYNYQDSSVSFGSQAGFSLDLQGNTYGNKGWYSELAVARLVTDLNDSDSESGDFTNIEFSSIFDAITNNDYINFNGAQTIFTLLSQLESDLGSSISIQNTAATHGVNSTQAFGQGEFNDNDDPDNLPLYQTLAPGSTITVCTNDNEGTFNKLGNYRFAQISVSISGNYTLSMDRISGADSRDPDMILRQGGTVIASLESSNTNSESDSVTLNTGDYWLEAYDFQNLPPSSSFAGDACFNIRLN